MAFQLESDGEIDGKQIMRTQIAKIAIHLRRRGVHDLSEDIH